MILLLLSLFSVVFCQTDNMSLILLSQSLSSGAACLDGTAPAYYFRRGYEDGTNKWFIYHQGGGWCTSLEDCLSRSKTVLGSSASYPHNANYNTGYFSITPNVNPLMYNWNVVYLQYCDGASFSGNNDTITVVDGTKLYFRGFVNLKAYLNDLNTNHQLQKGTDFVIGGCSAGGLAIYLHIDWWKQNLPANARVRGLPDSGYFLDYNSPNYAKQYSTDMRWVFQQHNVSSGVNQKCILTQKPLSDCIFAEHTVPYITTPFFPLQSRYDSWQLDNILGTKNNDTLVNNYGQLFDQRFMPVSKLAVNGYFLDSCYHHCAEWNSIRIQNQLSSTAMMSWYNDSPNQRYFQNEVYPCQDCCNP